MQLLNNFRIYISKLLRGKDKKTNYTHIQYDLSFMRREEGHTYAEYNIEGNTPKCSSECNWNHMRF